MSDARASAAKPASRAGLTLVFWALITGGLAGVIGGAFRLSIDGLAGLAAGWVAGTQHLPLPGWIAPVVTSAAFVATAVYLVRRFAPEAGGSGVQEIEGALDELRPVRWRRVLPVKFVGGVLSLGSGLALGREGPCIQLGGAVGRMLSDALRLSHEGAHVLLAAGAGAGLTAAFGAPFAGMLFVLEEMRPQFHYNVVSVQSVIVACAAADIAVIAMIGSRSAIPMEHIALPALGTLWLFPVLGALLGFAGVVFNRALVVVSSVSESIPDRWGVPVATAIAAAVSALAWFIPDLAGGGYTAIHDTLAGSIAAEGLLVVCLARFCITLASYGTGAPGGIFAPMVALGTLLGFWFGDLAGSVLPALVANPAVFVVAGMGALFAASVRAPLTGIALAVEITGNYAQILPVALACVASTLVAHVLGGQPIYAMLLKRTLGRASSAA